MKADNYLGASVYTTFELMLRVCVQRKRDIFSFILCSLFNDAPWRPRWAGLDIPRPTGWKTVFNHYRTLHTTLGIRLRDVLLQLTIRQLFIGLYVQDYLWLP